MRRRLPLAAILLAAAAAGGYAYLHTRPTVLVLTGIVTTDDVIVSPQVAGRIGQLLVKEGDTVRREQMLAVIEPDELRADTAYYAENVQGLSSQVRESEATLRFQQKQTADQIAQAESTLQSTEAQAKAATADLENARLVFTRTQSLAEKQIASPQEADQARTTFNAAQARVDALNRQVEAQRSAVALARSNAEQVAMRRDQVQTNQHMAAAAAAQRTKADVRLALHRDPRADRRHRRRPRRPRRRVRQRRAADRHADRSRRSLGPRRRRGDLHRSRAASATR